MEYALLKSEADAYTVSSFRCFGLFLPSRRNFYGMDHGGPADLF